MSFKYASMLIGAVALAGLASQTALAEGRDRGHDHWEQLGCQKVGFLVDRDVIRVGRREGTFKAIRLEVAGNAVYMNDLKVVYGNGVPDDIQVRSEIRDGGQTVRLQERRRRQNAPPRPQGSRRARHRPHRDDLPRQAEL